jgi:hypothetical protein
VTTRHVGDWLLSLVVVSRGRSSQAVVFQHCREKESKLVELVNDGRVFSSQQAKATKEGGIAEVTARDRNSNLLVECIFSGRNSSLTRRNFYQWAPWVQLLERRQTREPLWQGVGWLSS